MILNQDYNIHKSLNKMKSKICHTVGTVSKTQHNRRKRGQIDTNNAHIHDYSLSWLGAGTSMKSGGSNWFY